MVTPTIFIKLIAPTINSDNQEVRLSSGLRSNFKIIQIPLRRTDPNYFKLVGNSYQLHRHVIPSIIGQ